MDELLALQKELAAVQSAPSVFRLAEPNVVEVMMKLAEFGLIEVLHTSNGKEYLTPKQLRNEVADEIFAHNGRINITELAPILNVDLPYIERAADELLKHDDGLQLFQGELIASYYLDSLAEEINQTLQGAGRITLAELAVQHTLPTDFMQKLIEPRLGTVVQAKLAAGVLYTTAYVARHAARVRGTLAAVLRPTSLAQLLRERGFNEALFYENVDGLKASCMLPGSLQGKSSYTPALHTHAQVAGVRTFYEQNGLIEYAALAKMAVRDPRAYLQSTYAGGIALETCYIRSTLLRNVEEEVEEACANKWALDVRAAFTHELTDADVDALLDASPSIKTALSARAVRLGAPESPSGLIASASLLAECAEGAAVDELVKGTAEKEFQAAAAERKECLGVLPGPPQRALAELDRSLSAKSNVAAFLDALEAAEATLGAPCPPLDKKREKAAVDKARGAYRTPLAVESEPSVALHLTVLLLHLEINGVLLETSLPLKLLPPLIEALEPKLPEGPRGMLLACAKSALEVVLGGEGADGARDELRGGLEAVRSIGMSGGADAGGGNEESAPSAPKPPPAKRRMKKTDD